MIILLIIMIMIMILILLILIVLVSRIIIVGEFLGFFDCHVAPNVGWYKEVIQHLKEKSRRLVVPQIGDLDLYTALHRNEKEYIEI